jgi:hypothetical protein
MCISNRGSNYLTLSVDHVQRRSDIRLSRIVASTSAHIHAMFAAAGTRQVDLQETLNRNRSAAFIASKQRSH